MYEIALYLTAVATASTVFTLDQLREDRDRTYMALLLFSIVLAIRGVLLYNYFNTPEGTFNHLMFRAVDFLIAMWIVPLGIEMTRANIIARVNRISEWVLQLIYGTSVVVPGVAAIGVFVLGIDLTRRIIIPFGGIIFTILLIFILSMCFNNPLKVERPELSKGAKLILIGYLIIITGEMFGAGVFNQVDLAFCIISGGIPFIVAGCTIMRTVTFAGLYTHLDVGFVLVYKEKNIEMTNLGGKIEEGRMNTLGVLRAKSVIKHIGSEIRKCMRTGTSVVIPQITLPVLNPDAIFQIDIVPYTRDRKGGAISVLILIKDITLSLKEYETEQLRKMVQKIAHERDQAVNLADVLRHDIANILQGIQMAIEVVQVTAQNDPTILEDLEIAQEGLKKASNLIDIVRDMRRAEEEESQIVEIKVSQIIDNVTTRLKAERKNQKFRFGIRVKPDDLVIYGEPLVEQALFYLLEYCSPDNRDCIIINIDAYTDYNGNSAVIEIVTYENVVDSSQRKSLLQWRSEAARPGEGLSLPFARTIIERSGGDIRVEDRIQDSPEEGTKFILRLPLSPPTKVLNKINSISEQA